MIVCTTVELAEALFEHLQLLQIRDFHITVSPHEEIQGDEKVFFFIKENLAEEQLERLENLISGYNNLLPEQSTIILDSNEIPEELQDYSNPVNGLKIALVHSDTEKELFHDVSKVLFLYSKFGFGIGLHPSTVITLRAMKDILAEKNIQTIVDIGSGSGILSLYAMRNGVEKVVAYEIQDEAIESMKQNIVLNGLDITNVTINPREDMLKNLDPETTLYVANMRPQEVAMCENILEYGKHVIVSGMLLEEVNQYPDPIKCYELGEWRGVILKYFN